MAQQHSITSEIENIRGKLLQLHDEITRTAEMLSKTIRSSAITDEDIFQTVKAGVDSVAEHQRDAEDHLVGLACRLSELLDNRLATSEAREVPTRFERYLGYVSGAAMRRVQDKRWRRFSAGRNFDNFLIHCDGLLWIIAQHRHFLIARRNAAEKMLEQFIRNRGETVSLLMKRQGGATKPQMVEAVETFANLFQRFVDIVNNQVASANALTNLLTIEAERFLLLRDMLQAADAGSLPVPVADLPHLAPLVGLYEQHMLSVHEVERRRGVIEQVFRTRFRTVLDKRDTGHYVKG